MDENKVLIHCSALQSAWGRNPSRDRERNRKIVRYPEKEQKMDREGQEGKDYMESGDGWREREVKSDG